MHSDLEAMEGSPLDVEVDRLVFARVDTETLRRLDALSDERDVPRSALIAEILGHWVAKVSGPSGVRSTPHAAAAVPAERRLALAS